MMLSWATVGFDRLTQVGNNMISQGIEYQKVDVKNAPNRILNSLAKRHLMCNHLYCKTNAEEVQSVIFAQVHSH